MPKLEEEDLVVPVDAVISNEEAGVEEVIEPAGETEGGEASTAHCRTIRDTYVDYTRATLISYMIHWEACFSFVSNEVDSITVNLILIVMHTDAAYDGPKGFPHGFHCYEEKSYH